MTTVEPEKSGSIGVTAAVVVMAGAPKPRRRQAGDGTIAEYRTGAGPRFLIKYAEPQADGTKRMVLRRGFRSRSAAAVELRAVLARIDSGRYVSPSRITFAAYLDEWLSGLRLRPSTIASYRKNVRLHVAPYVGDLRLDQITGTRLTALYRTLETDGRADGTGGLSARTVRYVATIVHAALGTAVRTDRLAINPADKATPPTARQAAAPEMRTWTGDQLRAFLAWSKATEDEDYIAWILLAMTGLRRGEALGLRWSDVDLDKGTASVRRSATLIKSKGAGERITFGPPKSGKARVIDLDARTVAQLRAHRLHRASLSLGLVRDDALVLSRLDGGPMHPERFSRAFQGRIRAAAKALGEDVLPVIRLHDLRHSHATLLLAAGVPVKVVSERLGHVTPMITLTVYAHTMPGMQRDAVDRLARAVFGA